MLSRGLVRPLVVVAIAVAATACLPRNANTSLVADAGGVATVSGVATATGVASAQSISTSTDVFTGPPIFLPDPAKTPGKLCTTSDPDFKELRYGAQIPYCERAVSESEKAQVAAAYGVPKEVWDQYEFDHYYPLAIGGSDAPENIWPQRLDAARVKDKLEDQLYHRLAAGTITQADAVAAIRAWTYP